MHVGSSRAQSDRNVEGKPPREKYKVQKGRGIG